MMAEDLVPNFEYIIAYAKDYIEEGKLFDIFEIEEIQTILKNINLTSQEFVGLLNQSSPNFRGYGFYECTRDVTVPIKNLDEAIAILKSMRERLGQRFIDDIVNILNQTSNQMSDLMRENSSLRNFINNFQVMIKNTLDQHENDEKEIASLKSAIGEKERIIAQITEQNNKLKEEIKYHKEIFPVIDSMKKCNDFNTLYNFFDGASRRENQNIMKKAIEERLNERIIWDGQNVLHCAISFGNFNLVEKLIECGCNKEGRDKSGKTPLICAAYHDRLEIVAYLISLGADKEARDNDGNTPLHHASRNGYLRVCQYLIQIGADKKAINYKGETPRSCADSTVRNSKLYQSL
ncbi:hypothetical protein TVAG_475710 [Trichomonas vaginalis G3]|uniref:Uncharacterized protein n=1 Tax=Trichomonas vaginalis (strain ATCC PRA-98 / G3) TaxID=412133 RepID=A2D9Z5_TRIV3|nr:spectrin binding [Trichomonas vaginalis G3]EAY22643.1 hypothetical protein TVAG_475710 [Trichomonas vaginalis G3]KAI5525457.1 spectrin binding [Trichomonas vaginalis G3]|eukprot:XP_001583629.1 hypothetical protein [Trichomonas vaginalis G3]